MRLGCGTRPQARRPEDRLRLLPACIHARMSLRRPRPARASARRHRRMRSRLRRTPLGRPRRVVPAARGRVPRGARGAEPGRPARPHRRRADGSDPVRRHARLRGRPGQAGDDPAAGPLAVGGAGAGGAVPVRRGDHRLGGRASRAGARQPGPPRPSRAHRPRHAGRARGADRRAARGARQPEGDAQHLSRRGGRAASRRRSSGWRPASATLRRSHSTTHTSVPASSSRPRPTR